MTTRKDPRGTALIRPLPDRYPEATVRGGRERIVLERARAQHLACVEALRGLGLEVLEVPVAHDLPDSVFVEDMAVVAAGRALLTRSGHPGRRREAASVAARLDALVEVVRMRAPATLDGGDVLQVGEILFVGRSERTDAAGIEVLRRTFEPLGLEVREIPVRGALHLKCHCSSPGPGRVLLAEGFADPAPFEDVAEVLTVPPEEAYAANVVGYGGRVLVAAGYPRTEALLAGAGYSPIPLDISEIRKGDGSLTCLSIRL